MVRRWNFFLGDALISGATILVSASVVYLKSKDQLTGKYSSTMKHLGYIYAQKIVDTPLKTNILLMVQKSG